MMKVPEPTSGGFVAIDNSPRGKLINLLGAFNLDIAKLWVDELIAATERIVREEDAKRLEDLIVWISGEPPKDWDDIRKKNAVLYEAAQSIRRLKASSEKK